MVKHCLSKDAYKLGTVFLSKNKVKGLMRRAPASFENLIFRVKKIIQPKPSVFDLPRIDEVPEIIQTLKSNNSLYHKGCYQNLNDSHYERLVQKVQKQRSEGSLYSAPNPHKQTITKIRKAVCLFCNNEDCKDKMTAAGEYHSVSNNPNTKHMELFTGKWKQMTMQLGELDVHAKAVLCQCSSF